MKQMIVIACAALLVGCAAVDQNSKGDMTMDVKPDGATALLVGRCHCGDVSYEAQGPIVKSTSCDCDGCRRATGTLNVPFVSVRRAGFKITAGEPSVFRADSGVKCDAFGVWSFCSKCGTQLFWTGDTGDEIDIFAGTLDDTSVFQPNE